MATVERPAQQGTDRTRVRRLPDRGRYDRATIDRILDEALICHLGFVDHGQPFVIPTIHARAGDHVYVHGSTGSRALRTVADGAPMCLTATIVDSLIFARSPFNHSMNYRSVIVLGTAREVVDPDEKMAAMRAVVDHVAPGRWNEIREPTAKEFAATAIISLPLDEASAKVRTGPPHDDEEDLELAIWAGEVPLRLVTLPARPDPLLREGFEPTPAVAGWDRPSGADAEAALAEHDGHAPSDGEGEAGP
jgi:nitroimidazol reductase NimA-like FMN-containing flavoprotein (pyridoxamine 5'-phosphate oxidase superfamily)